MKQYRKSLSLLMIAGSLFLTGCQQFLNIPIGTYEVTESSAEALTDPTRFEITNTDYRTESTDPISIDLNQIGTGTDSYNWNGSTLNITQTNDYVLSGTLTGNIVVNVFNDENIHLLLNNVEIHSENGPAIYIQKAGKVILTSIEGTTNTLSDSVIYSEDNPGCIFSNVDLTINGSGLLNVYGYFEDAIRSKDLLKLVNTNVYVKSNQDGLRGNDGVIIVNSNTIAESENIGIRSVSEKDMTLIHGGICKVVAGQNAVSANRHVSIFNCQADLYSVEEAVACNGIRDIQEGILTQ